MELIARRWLADVAQGRSVLFGKPGQLRIVRQELVEPGDQFQVALEIAEKIAKAAPLGVSGSLSSSKVSVSEGQEAAKQRLFPDLQPVMASEDVKEGIQSFLERREAVFKGQ